MKVSKTLKSWQRASLPAADRRRPPRMRKRLW